MGIDSLDRTLATVAGFYDGQKYGCEGVEGYRKSTLSWLYGMPRSRCGLREHRSALSKK